MPKYALIADYDYPDDFCIVSDNLSDLEELALSIWEEDYYEWFYHFIQEDFYNDVKPEVVKTECLRTAIDYAWHYGIKPVTILN